jgi:hypothetical protein
MFRLFDEEGRWESSLSQRPEESPSLCAQRSTFILDDRTSLSTPPANHSPHWQAEVGGSDRPPAGLSQQEASTRLEHLYSGGNPECSPRDNPDSLRLTALISFRFCVSPSRLGGRGARCCRRPVAAQQATRQP